MSHRSRFGIVNANGSVESIYVHNGGHLQDNGKMLYEHYQDEDKVRSMIRLGDMSTLGQYVGAAKNPFDNRDRDICCFYHRDRGEEFHKPIRSRSMETYQKRFLATAGIFDIEFLYAFKDGAWYWSVPRYQNEPFKMLSPSPWQKLLPEHWIAEIAEQARRMEEREAKRREEEAQKLVQDALRKARA